MKVNILNMSYTFWKTSLNTTFVVEDIGVFSESWIKIFNPDLL